MRAQLSMILSLRPATTLARALRQLSKPARLSAVSLASGVALNLGGCAQPPPQRLAAAHSKEYFPSSIYGQASPRVVADGEPVPRGGGTYLVGKPYTVAGRTYYPSEKRYAAVGLASWYGDAFHGRLTANGEIYDRDAITAAHPTMPLPCYARVTNLQNHYSMIVRVNDRGPFAANRIMDVSRKTAELLAFQGRGTTPVKVEYVGAASLDGSDDITLLATLRSNGPAKLAGLEDADAPLLAGTPLRGTAATVPLTVASNESAAAPPAEAVSQDRSVPLPPIRPDDLTPARSRTLALR